MPLISEENAYTPVVGNKRIPTLLSAEDSATVSFTINSLQTGTYKIMKCCKKWYHNKNKVFK
jgi:hypothetical protein